MMVECYPAIMFKCEKCGKIQFHEDALDYEPLYDGSESRWVRMDNIDCDCGHTNNVFMDL